MTPDQAPLLRKAHSSLHAARLLADEQLFDFAVSRAYYTMFYAAETFLLGKASRFPSIRLCWLHSANDSPNRALCHRSFINTSSTEKTAVMSVITISGQDYPPEKPQNKSVELRSFWTSRRVSSARSHHRIECKTRGTDPFGMTDVDDSN